jgi:nucleotide-binding universal stress UspA family protein
MKSLLMILSGGPQSADALKSAVVLQKALGARLIVAHPTTPLPAEDVLASDAGTAISDVEAAEAEHSTVGARRAFDAVCGGDPTCRFRETHMTPSETLRKHSLFADVVILGRDKSEPRIALDRLKASLVTSRMPTLWLPPVPVIAAPRTVVCVWNGQAPSARAIKAALPLMALALRVIIIEYAGDEVNHSRLENYLDIHGIKGALWQYYGSADLTARGRARALMAEAKTAESDLMVMGAYGGMVESYFSLGRATEKVAEAATVPVLFHG